MRVRSQRPAGPHRRAPAQIGRAAADGAEIAWYADELTAADAVRPAGWPTLLDRILPNGIAISGDEDLWAGGIF